MEATADLRKEHIAVGRMLSILRRMAAGISAGGRPDADDFRDVGEFLRVFVDRCHHGKEEGYLFPAIERDAPELAPVTERLREQHVRGRELTSAILSLSAMASERPGDSSGALVDTIADYTMLLREHIDEEDRDCFTPADRMLAPQVQRQLAADYDRLEAEVIGEGRHEEFHRMLERLDARYAAPVPS